MSSNLPPIESLKITIPSFTHLKFPVKKADKKKSKKVASPKGKNKSNKALVYSPSPLPPLTSKTLPPSTPSPLPPLTSKTLPPLTSKTLPPLTSKTLLPPLTLPTSPENLLQLPKPALYQILLNTPKNQINSLCITNKVLANICKEPRFQDEYNAKYPVYFKAEDESVANDFRETLEKGTVIFEVLDNGGRPFRVSVNKDSGGKLKVLFESIDEDEENYEKIMTIEKVDNIWLGCGEYDNPHKRDQYFDGNTALIVKGNTCISVASKIQQFQLQKNEYITRYISTVGNSGVPYGYIQTNMGYYALDSLIVHLDFFH